MKLFFAFLCSAVSFPLMLFERFAPIPPDPAKVAFDPGRSWFHNMKNLTTETLRADCQWWSKALSFLFVVAVVT